VHETDHGEEIAPAARVRCARRRRRRRREARADGPGGTTHAAPTRGEGAGDERYQTRGPAGSIAIAPTPPSRGAARPGRQRIGDGDDAVDAAGKALGGLFVLLRADLPGERDGGALVGDGDGKAPQGRAWSACKASVTRCAMVEPLVTMSSLVMVIRLSSCWAVIGRVMPSHERSPTIDAIGVVAGRVPRMTPVEGAATRVASQLRHRAMRLVGDRRDGTVGTTDDTRDLDEETDEGGAVRRQLVKGAWPQRRYSYRDC